MSFRILVTDEIDPEGVALLAGEPEFNVDEVPTLPPAELLARIPEYDAFVGRSATRVSAELLKAATRLKVIGRAGVGVDNIALGAATELGIAVINAPAGNTIAVAELFFGVVISLLRHLPRAYESMHAGRWERSSFLGSELKGRTLGIVGLGRIGGEVACRAQTFGMTLVAYDPYITESRFQSLRVRRAESLDELLDDADIVTVHTPLTDETRGMIGRRELARLSPSAIVVNMARGGIVDEEALAEALNARKLAAAAVDAFVKEPVTGDHPLSRMPNVFLTPHIGASTAEAQRNVAVDACAAVRDALLSGEYSRSINVPEGEYGKWEELRPARLLARRAAAIGRAILASQGTSVVGRIDVRGSRALAAARETLVASAALGVLEGVLEQERLNLINAQTLAEGRGIELSFTEAFEPAPGLGPQQTEIAGATRAVEVRLTGGMNDITVGGIAYAHGTVGENGDGAFRITRIGAFRVDVYPRDTLVILTNRDVPGVIGHVGTLLGESGVNIAEYHQARLAQGGEALAAVSVDGGVGEDVKRRLLELPDVRSVTVVSFRKE
ncbi:MAG TPA: phosphoglycerate dehydrogenase [Gemmatimonadaceae bacterium]